MVIIILRFTVDAANVLLFVSLYLSFIFGFPLCPYYAKPVMYTEERTPHIKKQMCQSYHPELKGWCFLTMQFLWRGNSFI